MLHTGTDRRSHKSCLPVLRRRVNDKMNLVTHPSGKCAKYLEEPKSVKIKVIAKGKLRLIVYLYSAERRDCMGKISTEERQFPPMVGEGKMQGNFGFVVRQQIEQG